MEGRTTEGFIVCILTGLSPEASRFNKRVDGVVRVRLRLASYNNCDYIRPMVVELKLRKVGNSVGLVLPKEALARLNAEEGDPVYLTETTDGGFRLTASNPAFAEKMKVAERLSRRYRHALRELAK